MTEKRFRFQTFTERLNALDVNVSRTLECEEELEGLETHFLRAVTKWAGINLTEAWSECLAEMNPLCRSLPMLVHHSERIVNLLLGHLDKQKEVPDCVGAEPILGLISALARDLRKDLVPHLPRIFTTLRDLIDPTNPKLLEYIFQCHSYLIKYLGRYMADDLGKYICLYQPIFVHHKHYIRHFAAESFSYLMRRMNSEESMEHALGLLYEMDFGEKVEYGADTLSIILFETMKSIQGQFHSRAMCYLELLLKCNASATMPQKWALKATLLRMRNHAQNMDNAEPILQLFFAHFPTTPGAEALWYLDVIISWVVTKPRTQGSFHDFVRRTLLAIAKIDGCAVVEGKSGAFPPKTISVRDAAGRCILTLWRFLPDSTLQCISGRFVESHSHLAFPVEWSFFVEALRQNVQRFERTPFFSRAAEQAVAKIRKQDSTDQEREEAWFVLEKVVLLGSTTPLTEILFSHSASKGMLKCALAWYKEKRTAEECAIAAQAISKELQTCADVTLQADLVVLGSLVNMENLKHFVEGWWTKRWDTYEVINAVAQIAPRLGVPSHDLKHMFANCGSPDKRIRESTLRILRHMDDSVLAKEVTAVSEEGELTLGDSVDADVQLLVAACLRLEEIRPSLETERPKSNAIRTVLVQVSQGPRTWIAHAAVRIALSQLFVPFSTLWSAVVEHATILLEEQTPAEPSKKKRKKEKCDSVDGWWNNTLWRIVAQMIAKIRIAEPDVIDEEEEKMVEPQSARYQHRTKGMNIKNKRALEIDDCSKWDEQFLFADPVHVHADPIRWTDDITVDEWSWKLLGKLLCQSKEKQKHQWVAAQMVCALEGRYVTRTGLCRSRSYFLHVCHAAAGGLDCPANLDPLVQFGTVHHMLLDYNATVQKSAVDILARLKSTRAVVEKYKQQLNHLCDDKSFRDALLTLAVEGSEDDRMFPRPEHTAQVMPMVHRIVFSKIFKRGNAIDKNSSQHARRAAAYSTLSPAMEDQKGLAPLLSIMLENLLHTDMDDSTEGSLQRDIRRAEQVKTFVESYDPSQDATWQPTKVWSWEGISLRVGEEMVTKYLGFLNSLQDFMTQLGSTLAPFAQLLVQLCVSILEQTSLSGKAHGDGSDKLLSTQRTLVRGCLQRLQTLVKFFPAQVDWVKCMGPASTSLTYLIGQIPVSSGAAQVSAIAKFVCSWSEIPELYHLYDVFPNVLPSLFKVPAAASVLGIINNTDLRGGPVVEMVVNTALRLCRGGLLNLKAARKEAKSFREAARQKRKKKREDMDSASEMSDECEDENGDTNDHEPGFMTNKERLKNAAIGQKLLMPHVNVLLQSLHVLVAQRKTKRSKKYDQVVRLHELELMSTVAEWMTEPSVAYQLVDLLLKALADAPNAKNTNVALLLMDSLIKLLPKALPWGLQQEDFGSMVVVSSVHTRIAMLFSSLHDIRGRQKLGEVLVACEASLYFRDEQKTIEYLKKSRDIPIKQRWKPDTSALPAQPQCDAHFTKLHVAHLVHALNALTVSAALEPDADLHVDILEDIASNHLSGEKSCIICGDFMIPLANHLTFVLAMETCDFGVRHSVERVLTALATRLQGNPTDTGVLFVMQSRIVPSLRRILRSPYDDALRAGLKVLGHYVRALGPLAAEFDNNVAKCTTTPGASYQSLFHSDLVPLLKNSTGDEGGDLFGNLLHLQKHRRGRGLIMLAKAASTLSQPTLTHFVLPLCYNGLLQRSTATASYDPNYSENSLTCMQAAIARSTWNACLLYIRLLSGCLKKWHTRQKVIIKSICGCLNAFPFQGAEKSETRRHNHTDGCDDKDDGLDAHDGDDDNKDDEEEQEEENPVDQRRIDLGTSLKKRIVPILKKILWDKSSVSPSTSTQAHDYDEKKAKATPDRGVVRVGVVGVLLHVFRYMASSDFNREVPRLLYTLMEALESRDKEHREEARKAVHVVMGALGPQWFVWLTKELKERMTKGYQQPVCIFTTHCALAALVSEKNANAQNNSFLGKCQVGEVDQAVPTLLEMVEDELARVADPEKSDEEMKERRGQVKEAKKLRGPDILNLLARVTAPKKVLHDVVQFLYDLLCEERGVRLIGSAASRAYSQKYLHRVGELLQQTLAGLQLNAQFTHSMQVEFTSSLLSHGVTLLKHKEGQGEDASSLFGRSRIEKENTQPVRKKDAAITVQDGAAQGKGLWVGASRQSGFDAHARAEVLATAGLHLMLRFVRSSGLDNLDEHTQRSLHNLTPQIVECFCSTKDALLITSAKCLLRLQAWSPLPASLGRRVALTVLKVFQYASGQQDLSKRLQQRGHGGADLIPACSRLLTGLLTRESSTAWFTQLSQTPMRALDGVEENHTLSKREKKKLNKESATFFDALLAQICVALDHKKLQPSALALLRKVILKRNILRASVYDCVDVVGELMVKSGSQSSDESIPKLCANIYVDFLLDYPHDTDGLDKRIGFLITNLTYSEEGGRRAILNALHNIVATFPLELLAKKYAAMIFLPVASRLSQESDALTHEMLHILIKALLERVSSDTRQHLLAAVTGWQKSPKPLLLASLAEALGLMTPILAPKQRLNCLEVLAQLVQTDTRAVVDHGSPVWRTVYCACKSFEELFKLNPSALRHDGFIQYLLGVDDCLVPSAERHPWIVSIGLRLLADHTSDLNVPLGPLLHQVVLLIQGPLEHHGHLAHAAIKAVVRCVTALLADPALAQGGPDEKDLQACVTQMDSSDTIAEEEKEPDDEEGSADEQMVNGAEGDQAEDDEKDNDHNAKDDREDIVDPANVTDDNAKDDAESLVDSVDVPDTTLYERAQKGMKKEKKIEPLVLERSSSSSSPPALRWAVVRLSYETRRLMGNLQDSAIRLGAIVRLFGHLSVLLPREVLVELLEPLLTPCFRLQTWSKDMPSREIKDISELATLENNVLRGCLGKFAEETMEALSKSMGVGNQQYAQALAKVRSAVMERRRKRKADKKLLMVKDPEKAKAQRIAKTVKKTTQRKRRKHEVVKQKRGLIAKGFKA